MCGGGGNERPTVGGAGERSGLTCVNEWKTERYVWVNVKMDLHHRWGKKERKIYLGWMRRKRREIMGGGEGKGNISWVEEMEKEDISWVEEVERKIYNGWRRWKRQEFPPERPSHVYDEGVGGRARESSGGMSNLTGRGIRPMLAMLTNDN